MEFINSIGLTLVSFVFVLGVMIFIHELGHFLVARYFGIRVEVFSLGFGARLFGFKRGDTDYRVCLVPLGGYVKMAGETYDEDIVGAPDEFLSQPKINRFFVAIAGPAMNIVLALLLMTITLWVGIPALTYQQEPARIGFVEAGSPAEEAGMLIGDTIVNIDGVPTEDWGDAQLRILTSPEQRIPITIERDGVEIHTSVVSEAIGPNAQGYIGVGHYVPSFLIGQVLESSPAQRADLREGDEILRVVDGDESVSNYYDISDFLSVRPDKPLTFTIRRSGSTFERVITPTLLEPSENLAEGQEPRAGIGIIFTSRTHLESYPIGQAVLMSFKRNYELTKLLFEVLGKLVTGRSSIKHLSGPIEIAKLSAVAASRGAVPLLMFMAFISLQLGIINLFPIPILDGGVIALLAVEGLLRRDFSLRTKERITQVGFYLILLLMSVVIFNDLYKATAF